MKTKTTKKDSKNVTLTMSDYISKVKQKFILLHGKLDFTDKMNETIKFCYFKGLTVDEAVSETLSNL